MAMLVIAVIYNAENAAKLVQIVIQHSALHATEISPGVNV